MKQKDSSFNTFRNGYLTGKTERDLCHNRRKDHRWRCRQWESNRECKNSQDKHPSLWVHIQVPWAPLCWMDHQCHLRSLFSRFDLNLRRAYCTFKTKILNRQKFTKKKIDIDMIWSYTARLQDNNTLFFFLCPCCFSNVARYSGSGCLLSAVNLLAWV